MYRKGNMCRLTILFGTKWKLPMPESYCLNDESIDYDLAW